MLRIYAFIFGLLFVSSSRALSAEIKNADCDAWVTDTVRVTDSKRADTDIKGVQYSSPQEAAAALEAKRRMPFLAGVSISADLCGAIMAACTPYGQYEAAARLNLRGRYFPVFEMGMGVSNHTNDATDLHYKVHSPYYRIGLDYNVAKNVRAQGRIFVGCAMPFQHTSSMSMGQIWLIPFMAVMCLLVTMACVVPIIGEKLYLASKPVYGAFCIWGGRSAIVCASTTSVLL